jgi:hypothetical protein
MNQEQKPNGTKTPVVHTEEFKRSVVDHWCHSDKTAEQVAKDFGVKVWNVRDWRRRDPRSPRYLPFPPPGEAPCRSCDSTESLIGAVSGGVGSTAAPAGRANNAMARKARSRPWPGLPTAQCRRRGS